MMIKKWRPLWSYDIEKTERWLADMAKEGKRFAGVNLLSRKFLFESKSPEEIKYAIAYDKGKSEVSSSLKEAGWEVTQSKGNWQFLRTTDDVKMYPSKAGILKRNRLHKNILTGISILYSWQLLFFLTAMSVTIFGGVGEIVPSPFWSITILYFSQVIFVIWLSIHAARKLKQFERKYFDAGVDEDFSASDIFIKRKFGWRFGPDLLEKWLSDMALKGNHLVKIDSLGSRFTFKKGEPKHIAFVYDYQMNTSAFYYNVHKEAGWQLLLTSPSAWTKFSLWMKEYKEDEEKPIMHDAVERKAQVRKIALTSLGLNLPSLLIVAFLLYFNLEMILEDLSTFISKYLIIVLSLTVIFSLLNISRSIQYIIRMKKVLLKSSESNQ